MPQAGFELGSLGLQAGVLPIEPPLLVSIAKVAVTDAGAGAGSVADPPSSVVFTMGVDDTRFLCSIMPGLSLNRSAQFNNLLESLLRASLKSSDYYWPEPEPIALRATGQVSTLKEIE